MACFILATKKVITIADCGDDAKLVGSATSLCLAALVRIGDAVGSSSSFLLEKKGTEQSSPVLDETKICFREHCRYAAKSFPYAALTGLDFIVTSCPNKLSLIRSLLYSVRHIFSCASSVGVG